MTDAREARYALALLMATWPNGDRIEGVTKRTAELLAPGVVALADTELAALEQECRDRECTEQDVRARLADAENALTDLRGKIEAVATDAAHEAENSDRGSRMAAEANHGLAMAEYEARRFVWLLIARHLRDALDGTS